MKFILDRDADGNQWLYGKYLVIKSIHPKLCGKYEVHDGDKFIDRFFTKKEIKEKLCN